MTDYSIPTGFMTADAWKNDPRHVLFTMARYKFVAKMFEGFPRVLEIGCGDEIGAPIVKQTVGEWVGIDKDSTGLREGKWLDIVWSDDIEIGGFDGIFSLDVLEHIPEINEHIFIRNSLKHLNAYGVLLVGTPSLESQQYASPQSRRGHVNVKSHDGLRRLMLEYFHNVFMFSMNDEVVHTGFGPMAHYLIALCTGNRNR